MTAKYSPANRTSIPLIDGSSVPHVLLVNLLKLYLELSYLSTNVKKNSYTGLLSLNIRSNYLNLLLILQFLTILIVKFLLNVLSSCFTSSLNLQTLYVLQVLFFVFLVFHTFHVVLKQYFSNYLCYNKLLYLHH